MWLKHSVRFGFTFKEGSGVLAGPDLLAPGDNLLDSAKFVGFDLLLKKAVTILPTWLNSPLGLFCRTWPNRLTLRAILPDLTKFGRIWLPFEEGSFPFLPDPIK